MYGATNHVGTQVTKVFASHGYALFLVDGNLSKLQTLQAELEQVFPHLTAGRETLVRIANVNLGTDANSTLIEHKLHKALFGDNTWNEDEIYEENSEAFRPEAPQPPPVQQQRSHMKCLNIRVFVNCVALDKHMVEVNEKIFHELQFD